MKQLENSISSLIVKFIIDEINDTELAMLEHWLERSPANKKLFDSLLDESNFEKRILSSHNIDLNAAYSQLKQRIRTNHQPVNASTISLKCITVYAASILLPLTIGVNVYTLRL